MAKIMSKMALLMGRDWSISRVWHEEENNGSLLV